MAEVKGKGRECLPLKTLQEVIFSLQGIWRHYQSRIYDNDVRLLRVLLPPGIVHHFQSWPQVLDWEPQGPSCQSRQPTHPRFCWKRYPFRILHITQYKNLPEILRFSIRSPSYHLPGNPSGKYSWSSLLGSPLQKESKERPKCESILIHFFSSSYPHGWEFIISLVIGHWCVTICKAGMLGTTGRRGAR